MSYETLAYDNEHGDPVVVLVATGTHDVSRLVNLLNRGNTEQLMVGEQVARQVRRHNDGRAALRLLVQHGGADLTEPPESDAEKRWNNAVDWLLTPDTAATRTFRARSGLTWTARSPWTIWSPSARSRWTLVSLSRAGVPDPMSGYADPDRRDRLAHLYVGEPRVFLPGDEIPVGIWVMGRDRQPTLTWAPGKVRPDQPWGLVEVLLPDYERAFEMGYARRFNESEAS